ADNTVTYTAKNFEGLYAKTTKDYMLTNVHGTSSGTIYIDTSRYNNLKDIPNLGIGIQIADAQDTVSGRGSWYIASYTGCNGRAYKSEFDADNNKSGVKFDELYDDYASLIASQASGSKGKGNYNVLPGVRYAGTWPELIDETANSKTYSIKTWYSNSSKTDGDTGNWGVSANVVDLVATQISKKDLRLAVEYAKSNFPALGIYDSSLNSYFYNGTSSSDFENFKTYYRTACQALCKLDGVVSSSYDSTGELDVLAKNLNDAVSNLVNKGNNLKVSGTAHQYHIGLERTNNGQFRAAQIVGAKDVSKSFDARDNLYFTSDSFDGYTFAGAIIVNSTSNIDGIIRSLKTTNNVIDPRGSYISNENYYPASISQSGNSTTFTRSTSHNAYHPTSAKAPETIGADGTITFSWVGNKNNASTFGDFSVIYFYYPSQKVLYFDLNDGETAVNMLSSTSYNATNDSFFNFDNKFTYTQNGVTVKYDPLTCTYTFNGTATGDNFWGDSVLPVGFSSSKAYTAQFVVVGGKVQKTASDAENPKGCFVFEGKNSNGNFFTEPNRLNFDLGFAQGVDTKQTNTRSNLNATSVADSKMLNLRFWKNGSNPIYFENYQVKFQFIEGSTPNQKFSPNAKAISANDNVGTLPIPEREGYNFTGWYTEKSGGTRVTSGMIMGSSNRTVYAHWTPVSYHVLLDNEFDVDTYMNTAVADSNLTGYTNAYTNWKRSTDGTYANGTQPATNNATSVMKKTAEGEDYINFNYSYTATGEETFFDHYAFDAFTAENAGTYTADFKYKINDFYSEMQDVYGDVGYASAMLCLTDETKGSLYNDYSTHSENKDVTEGWQSSSLEISNVSAGDRIRFQFVVYFCSDAYPLNAVNANIDISHIVIRDGNGRVVWSSDQVSVSQGTGYLDYNAGSLTVKNTATSPTATNVEKDSRADIRAYKMELTAGVSYTLTVNYEAFSDNPTLQMFVFGCSDINPSTNYSGFWNNYVSNITSGRAVITFTPNETYHYVYLGLGSSDKSGGC
ncbi:MAG: InlB B-repeat-containing protein, partial [Ruminococcus sp.]|nr:InlB B-repeat-containing protein [Candidatus Copronaster equi]